MQKLTAVRRSWAVAVFCISATAALGGQTFRTLVSFNINNGNAPQGSLVQGLDGNLYGTTYYGGLNNGCGTSLNYGCGTVFKVTPSGDITVLYQFCAERNCPDGAHPVGALALGTDGNFYGVTTSDARYDRGTIFKITPTGDFKTIYNFCRQSGCSDGSNATGGLVLGPDGNFYGTTSLGGLSTDTGGNGTIFKVTPSGTLTTLYTFMGKGDGALPNGLILASDGNFYGTAMQGGSGLYGECEPLGCGTLFRITPAGKFSVLYSFCSQLECVDGLFPFAPPTQAADGNFYGTTNLGGRNSQGNVYRITPQGVGTTLYTFCSQYNCADGNNPTAAVIQATNGYLYGTTSGTNAWGSDPGTLFGVTTTGKLLSLYSFDVPGPSTGLMQHTNGILYGTVPDGGASSNCAGSGCGFVYSVSLELAPFVEAVPASASAGATVLLLGGNLTGTTSVMFSGTAATFAVISDTEIEAEVPAGATSGAIEVVTPTGTLTCNQSFRVAQ